MLEVLAAVLVSICWTIGIILLFLPFRFLIHQKQRKTLFLLYCTVGIAVMVHMVMQQYMYGMECIFDYLRYGSIFYLALMMLVNCAMIHERIREHIFVYGIVLNCHYLLLSVPNYIITLLHGLSANGYIFVVLGVYCALLILTFWPIYKLVCGTVMPFLNIEVGQYWKAVWFIPIAYFSARYLALGGEHNSGSIQQLTSSALSAAIIILICVNIAADYNRMRERQIMEKQLADQKLHYSELQIRVENARKARHDMKHHLAVIRHYIDINDKESLGRYVDELVERGGEEQTIPYSGNAAADGILYHYIQKAETKKIDFRYCGAIRSPGIADVDLCALLGNALDNAVAGCQTLSSGRTISVVSQSEEKLLSIIVRNSFDGRIEQDQGVILSHKRKNSPGIGLTSMKTICERYGGSMETQWDAETFTLMFILPLRSEPEGDNQ